VLFVVPAMAQTGTGAGEGQPGHANSTEKSSTDKGMITDKGMKSGTATTGMAAPKPMSSDTKKETDQKNASPASMDTGVKKEK
jgi:hypothetical protein